MGIGLYDRAKPKDALMKIEKTIKSLQYAFHLGIFLLWLYAIYGLYNWEIHPWFNTFILTSLGMISVGLSYLVRQKTLFIRVLFLIALITQLILSSVLIYDKNLLIENWHYLLVLALPTAFIIQFNEILKIIPQKLKIGIILFVLQLMIVVAFIFSPSVILKLILYISFIGIYLFARMNSRNKVL